MLFTLTEENFTEVQEILNDFIRQGLEVNIEHAAYFDLRAPIKLVNKAYKPYDEVTKEYHIIDFKIHDIKTMRISNLYCHIILK